MRVWLAVHTKPHAERRVAVALMQQNAEIFLPETRCPGRQKQTCLTPFFPGYLFLHTELVNANSPRWRWLPGLRHIVAYGDQPIPIPDEIIAMIARQVAYHNAHIIDNPGSFAPGDLVRIKNGPFQDMLAIFDGSIRPNQRVQVLLQALERSVRVRLSPSALERVAAEQKQEVVKRPRRTRGRGRRIRSR